MKQWIRRDLPRAPVPRASQPGSDATRDAMKRASDARAEALRRDPEVREVSDRLREVRRRNHFGELITRVLLDELPERKPE